MNTPVTTGKQAWEVLAEAMVQQYYQLFDTTREQLVIMYAPDAMFTFEEFKVTGQAAIKDVLMDKLKFQRIQHIVTKVDSQPTAENGVIIQVTGRLQTDNDPPHGFSSFYVKQLNGNWFIFHDIFRLFIHNG